MIEEIWVKILFILLASYLIILIMVSGVYLIYEYKESKRVCEGSGGELTSSKDCLIGDTLYTTENLDTWGIKPKIKLARLGVSEG